MFGPVEPSSDMRQGAAVLFGFYTSLINAGFSKAQALELTCQVIASSAGGEGE